MDDVRVSNGTPWGDVAVLLDCKLDLFFDFDNGGVGTTAIPCRWNDRDGCIAKNTKPFQGVDHQPYSLEIGSWPPGDIMATRASGVVLMPD